MYFDTEAWSSKILVWKLTNTDRSFILDRYRSIKSHFLLEICYVTSWCSSRIMPQNSVVRDKKKEVKSRWFWAWSWLHSRRWIPGCCYYSDYCSLWVTEKLTNVMCAYVIRIIHVYLLNSASLWVIYHRQKSSALTMALPRS